MYLSDARVCVSASVRVFGVTFCVEREENEVFHWLFYTRLVNSTHLLVGCYVFPRETSFQMVLPSCPLLFLISLPLLSIPLSMFFVLSLGFRVFSSYRKLSAYVTSFVDLPISCEKARYTRTFIKIGMLLFLFFN